MFSAHVFFGFQPLLVTMTQTSMHVPLHVLIIHHSPSRKDVHSISTEGQSALLTPSLWWFNLSSSIPQFLSHQRRQRHRQMLQLFMFCFFTIIILNMTKRRSNLLSRSNRSVKRCSTAHQRPNTRHHDHSDVSPEQRSSVDRFSVSPILIPLHSRRLHRART